MVLLFTVMPIMRASGPFALQLLHSHVRISSTSFSMLDLSSCSPRLFHRMRRCSSLLRYVELVYHKHRTLDCPWRQIVVAPATVSASVRGLFQWVEGHDHCKGYSPVALRWVLLESRTQQRVCERWHRTYSMQSECRDRVRSLKVRTWCD